MMVNWNGQLFVLEEMFLYLKLMVKIVMIAEDAEDTENVLIGIADNSFFTGN